MAEPIEDIPVEDFAKWMHENVDAFVEYWNDHLKNPDPENPYPKALSLADWADQFNAYVTLPEEDNHD